MKEETLTNEEKKYTLNITSQKNKRKTTKSFNCIIPDEEKKDAIETLRKLKKWTGINTIYLQRIININ